MFGYGFESFKKKHLENSRELQSQWREESLAKEKVYLENFKNAKGKLLY
jgi:hypothetical protein